MGWEAGREALLSERQVTLRAPCAGFGVFDSSVGDWDGLAPAQGTQCPAKEVVVRAQAFGPTVTYTAPPGSSRRDGHQPAFQLRVYGLRERGTVLQGGVYALHGAVSPVRTRVWEPGCGEQGWPRLPSLLGDFVVPVLTTLASSSDPESQDAMLSERDAGPVSLKVKLLLLVPRDQRAKQDGPRVGTGMPPQGAGQEEYASYLPGPLGPI